MRGRADHTSPGIGFERVVFFSDAVFAIAITLLVLDLKLPETAHGPVDLRLIAPKLLGFAVSFFAIGIYWMAHHRLFETLKGQDGAARAFNLLFLAAVAFLPFPTSVITERGPETSAVVFYSGSIAAAGFLFILLAAVARRPSLLIEGEGTGETLRFLLRASAAPLVFTGSAFVALTRPGLAMETWALVFPAVWLFDRVGRLFERASARTEQPSVSDAA
jgi:uncharacterized membrane protein